MNLRSSIALCAALLLPSGISQAQSIVAAKPVVDDKGFVAFQITETIRLEGVWSKAPAMGQLLYPQRREKATFMGRYGDSVIIKFPYPNDYGTWEGLHVHNGCIPALKGMTEEEFVAEVAKVPLPPAKSVTGRPDMGPAHYGVCPICGQRHIRL